MPGWIRQAQRFGSGSKIGSFAGFADDSNMNPRVYQPELHDPALRREVVRIADRENAGALRRFEEAALPLAFRSREKENPALSRLPRVGNQAD